MTQNKNKNEIKEKNKAKRIIFSVYLICLIAMFTLSFILDISWGKEAGKYFGMNLWEMVQIVPAAFILIALFEQWVKREHVISQLGHASGYKGYLWALLLAGASVGGVYVMFPLAASLDKKGASNKVIFAYLGFAGVCRIPMVMFEITFLGPRFTAIRLLTALPLLLVSGILLGRHLDKKDYKIIQNED